MTGQRIVCCNGAPPLRLTKPLVLEYRPGSPERNVRIGLPRFVQNVYHIPDRTLDLLELAAYLYAADRHTRRGSRDAVEFHAWSRRFSFRLRVRDAAFWNRKEVLAALVSCITFMTGDAEYDFEFLSGHKTPPTSLFDEKGFADALGHTDANVALFSGGLDSLAGAVGALTGESGSLVLVSHQSHTGTKRTQKALVRALQERFPSRVLHYPFECNLTGVRAPEETQRSRSFLYGAIGFAIAEAHKRNSFCVYENGVTSLNLGRREDLGNARASRTTHPRSLNALAKLLTLVTENPFHIQTPSFWQTKRDVVNALAESGHGDLIANSVSCSRTFQRDGDATHCGRCFQCLDRRLAVFSAGQEDLDDAGLYSVDIIREPIPDEESTTTAVDYLRQAAFLAEGSPDQFHRDYLSELSDVVDALPCTGADSDRIERVWHLMNSHGRNVGAALRRIRDLFDNPLVALPPKSLLHLVSARVYLRPAVLRLCDAIAEIVSDALGTMFRFQPPTSEPDLNAKLAALIGSHVELVSEHPAVRFACADAVPDHSVPGTDLWIESKYVRDNTPPSKAGEGIAADLTKYPNDVHILFLVYDPSHRIADDASFQNDFQGKGRCSIVILR